ncbi:MAG: aminodeoxychorismate/anthranilate synthase component II [Acidobacteriota bacterium]
MILFIDNYDSFTFNLVSMIGAIEPSVRVVRNDGIGVEEIEELDPSGIVLSPGPGTPAEAGVCKSVVRNFAGRIPILGVCLGHQAIAEAFGAKVDRAARPMHGKTSPVVHDGSGVLSGLPSPFMAGRYHSLAVLSDCVPDCLIVQGTTPDGEIMALRHRAHHCHGVQFHPESILTPEGERVCGNFVAMCQAVRHV